MVYRKNQGPVGEFRPSGHENRIQSIRHTGEAGQKKPHEAIKELRLKIRVIAKEVEDCSKRVSNDQEKVGKLQGLIFALETARGYLLDAFKAWQARQGKWASE